MVERYHSGLMRDGVRNYTWETCWFDYRCMAAELLLHPMRWWMNGLPEDFWRVFVTRALVGFHDLGCVELPARYGADR